MLDILDLTSMFEQTSLTPTISASPLTSAVAGHMCRLLPSRAVSPACEVICFTDSVPGARLPGELAVREVATAEALARGQLVILDSDQSWRKAGPLVAAAMIEVVATELDRATEQGYPGLRVTADMCWVTRPVAAVDQLVAFEQTVGRLFSDGRLTAICQYERDSFDPATLAFAARVHLQTVAAAVYHDTPLLRICRQHRPPGIRAAGELDFTQLEPLQQALAEALRLDADIHVNLTKLRFIDVTAATRSPRRR